jgi:hypothetical protein
LKKDDQAQADAFAKYLSLYAAVTPAVVHPLLWNAAQEGIKKKAKSAKKP